MELIDLLNSVKISLRWLTFLLESLTVTLTVLLFWIYFFLLTLVFDLQKVFPLIENCDHAVVSVSIDFPSNSKGVTMDYSRADLDGLHDHLRDILLGDIFKCGASTAASELCEWVQLGIDVYIPHRKYQIMRHSFSWFSAACTAVIAHIFSQRTFFCLYQQNLLNLKFRQLSNYCKNILEAVELPYANKTKSLSLS